MFDVDVYIETSQKGPAKCSGAAMWRLTYMGEEHTKDGMLWLEESTQNEATVRCLRDALGHFTKPSHITVHTTCGYVYGALHNGWFEKWSANKWRRSDGEPIGHVEDWYAISLALAIHTYTAVNEAHHSFTDYMRWELQKETARHADGKTPQTA